MRSVAFKLNKAIRQPVRSAISLLGCLKPELLLGHYARLARRQGLKRSYFILSFDCDTDLDIEVVEGVHARLLDIGITPVYAVPGQLLERGQSVYRRIADSGSEFVNHGYYVHTLYHPATRIYESFFFYDQLPHKTIVDDIQRGHRVYQDVLGKAPTGFRVPHFGTFQRPEQLSFLHSILTQMGYTYSSSTVPLYGFQHGPVRRVTSTLHEIPVSGCYNNPVCILDSWSFRYAPWRRVGEQDYLQQFEKMVRFFNQPGRSGLLNFYADPSQVYDWLAFFEAMKSVRHMAINSYENLLRELRQ